MADGRMLKKTIGQDIRVAQMGYPAQLLFRDSIPHLDIEGRMDGRPLTVRGLVDPANAVTRPQDWTDDLVGDYMHEWEEETPLPLVLIYPSGDVVVCHFPGFTKNQRLRRDREKPSIFPPPPPAMLAHYEDLRKALGVGRDAVPDQLQLQLLLDRARDAVPDLARGAVLDPALAARAAVLARDAVPDLTSPAARQAAVLARDAVPDLSYLDDKRPPAILRQPPGAKAEVEVQEEVPPPDQRVLEVPAHGLGAALEDQEFPGQHLVIAVAHPARGRFWAGASSFFDREIAPLLETGKLREARQIHVPLLAELGPHHAQRAREDFVAAIAKHDAADDPIRNRAKFKTKILQRIAGEVAA